MSDYQFRGIVAVGNTRAQAVNRYRLAATCKGITCFVDPNNKLAFVSNANADLGNTFNPLNGNIDLDTSSEALNDLQFQAKAGDVHHAYHHQCTAGCGMHLVFDEPSFVQHCPSCATALSAEAEDDEDEDLSDSELDDLDIEDAEDEEIDDSEDDDSVATASDEEESEEDSEEDDLGEESDSSDEEESEEDSEEDDMADAPLVVAASSRAEAVRVFSEQVTKQNSFKATASASGNAIMTAHYKVCASDSGCGAHIVGELALNTCPVDGCGNALLEPNQSSVSSFDEADADDMDLIDGEDSAEEFEDEDFDADDSDETEASMSLNKSQSSDEDSDMDLESDAGDDDESDEDSDDVEVDLLDDIADDVSDEDLDVSYSAAVGGKPAWTAYVKGAPVAMATQDTINPDHADLFGTPRFGQVAHAASKIQGVKRTLGELGFRGVKASLSVSKHVEQRVAALASAREEQMTQREAEFVERLQSVLATAAVGITRGFFEGQVNPVREQLNSALAGVGIRNPGLIVDNALQASFEPFLRTMFEKGRDIMSKPLEVQESLARSVVETAYVPKTYSATAGDAGEHPLDTRLAGIGTVVASDKAGKPAASKTESAVATAAAASDDSFNAKLMAAIGSLGRR